MCGCFDKVIFYWTLVARHISRCIDKDPRLKPQTLPTLEASNRLQIALSSTQEAQIREIFELFDTDGGGTIDRHEIDFAMVALGFQSTNKKSGRGQRHHATANILDTITADGHVTLEEFVKLMTGHEASGSDPMRAVATAFAVMSRSSHEHDPHENMVTFEKLRSVCMDYEVFDVLLFGFLAIITIPALPASKPGYPYHSLFVQSVQALISSAIV
jgi:Ca2+-binding EF-hand superfamily protein